MSYKLFIPGPVAVSEKTYKAMMTPIVGHRSKDFVKLVDEIMPRLKQLFYTNDPVFLSTSSSWGVMEGSLRNVVKKGVLNCCNGAFSDKWYDVSKRCGKEAAELKAEWGQPIYPEALEKELSTNKYDAVTIIHNETSTGTMSDIKALSEVLKKFPDVVSIVDTVSSFTAMPINKDELGIDVMVTGCQKALAIPPGLSFCCVSEKAMERAKTVEGRGYYFDFLEFKKFFDKNQTPSTPIISLLYALKSKLDDIFEEGVENRYARHATNNKLVRDWAYAHGFELFPEEKYGSVSLNCFKNNLNVDLPGLLDELKNRFKMTFNGGYGKIKGTTFRISNMGDETPETMKELLDNIDVILPNYINK
jgi:aspartate aminotransferase-like enzyme